MKSYFVAVALAAMFAPALAPSAFAKTNKECTAEWRADKKANQAAKITEKAYVEKCKSAEATPVAAPTAAPAVKPASPAPAAPKAAAPAAPQAPAAKTVAKPAAPAAGVTGANQFASDTQAKAKCPSDTVVWVNLSSKIYHFAGKRDYGKTKKGTYMCEKDAMASGSRAAKDEKHP
ncbi:MAG: hypothetical protein ABI830_04030 [Pseudolabrys sp.]